MNLFKGYKIDFIFSISIVVVTIFYVTSCVDKQEKKLNIQTQWFLENENKISKTLNQLISEDLNNPLIDTNWEYKSIVITENDTTILGEFAKRIKKQNSCYIIQYTFSKSVNEKKIVTILKDDEIPCGNLMQEPFLNIDSTTNFIIVDSISLR